jgi:integrase
MRMRRTTAVVDVADLEETEDGFKIIIRRSKTDQEGHGETIAIARGVTTCPIKAVKAWLQAAGISEGPLFRPVAKGGRLGAERLTDQSVCKVVKAYAERIGLKATDFGAHSLRAGFLTSAARRGASVFKMRDGVTAQEAWTCCRPMSAMLICFATMPGRGCCNS